jgi:hypothetical protein
VVVVVPTDRAVRQLIHRTIEFVVRGGPEFEDALIRRVGSDAAFRFLTETEHFEHTYYRWKVRARACLYDDLIFNAFLPAFGMHLGQPLVNGLFLVRIWSSCG